MPSGPRLLRGPPATEPTDPIATYLDRLAPSSRAPTRAGLDAVARILGRPGAAFLRWDQITYTDMQRVRSELLARYAPKTAASYIAATRALLKVCWRLDLLSAEQLAKLMDVRSIKGRRLRPQGRLLAPEEIGALFQACADDLTARGRRDAAMLAILYGSGIRRADVCRLQLADYEPDTGALNIRRGKGDKSRVVWIGTTAARRLVAQWIDVRGLAPGPLLCGTAKGGRLKLPRRALTGEGVRGAMQERAREAGIPRASPHSFRRTGITMLAGAMDLDVARRWAGHESIETTALYVDRDERVAQQASALLEIPSPSLFAGRKQTRGKGRGDVPKPSYHSHRRA